MNFDFDDQQNQLRESVRRYLAERAPLTPYVRENYGKSVGIDSTWTGLAELGVVGLLATAKNGGSGAGMVDAAVALEECGRALYPGPYIASAVGAISLLHLSGSDVDLARFSPQLSNGSSIGTIAVFEAANTTDTSRPTVAASPNGADVLIDGTKSFVFDAANADLFLVSAIDVYGSVGVYAVPRTDCVSVDTPASIDGTRNAATVRFNAASGSLLAGGDAGTAINQTLDRLRAALVVDCVGAAQVALDLSVAYSKERIAFDKPIGSFQAVQHLCADMLSALELSRAASYYACWALDNADAKTAHLACLQAAAYANEELPKLGAQAIQIFAGVGYTWEHEIHLYYKRLISGSALLGNADDNLLALADIILS